jgi:hypothetical protein
MNPMKKMINLNDLCNESRSNSRLSTEISEPDSSKIEIKRVKINFKTIPLFKEKQSIIIERKLILRNHKLFQDDITNHKKGTLEKQMMQKFEKLSKVKSRSYSFDGKNPLNLPVKSFLSKNLFKLRTNNSKSKISSSFKLPPIKRI